jgi:O-antigen/teichoic acid export membrane protein
VDAITNASHTTSGRFAVLTAGWAMARRWSNRILLAIVDQGAASTANFVLTILAAVWMPLDDFGRYVLIWSASVLIESAQVALITDSMPAIVSRYGRTNRHRLNVAGMWIVLAYSGVTSALILAAVPIAAVFAPAFALPLLCLAAVNPLQRLYIFFRRLCYIRDRQDAAATASAIYGATLLGGIGALIALGQLSVSALVLLWGLANGIAVLAIYRAGVARFERPKRAIVLWLIRALWKTGRWLAGAAIGFWIATWGMFPLVAALAGLEAAGILRALQNLFTPIVQFNAALNLAILPRVADKVVVVGRHFARSFALHGTIVFTAIAALYAGLMLAWSDHILRWAYGKPEIIAAAHLLWPLAVAASLESGRQGLTMALLAANRTRIFFFARMVAMVVFLVAAIGLHRLLGVQGILWATVISNVVATSLVVLDLRHIAKSAPPAWDVPRRTPAQ